MFNPAYFYNTIAKSFKSKLIAAYKLSNGNDSHVNSLNGTAGSAVIFSSTNAVDGNAGQFIGSVNSSINLGDNDLFSFTDGTSDKPFSIKANIYPTGIGGSPRDIFSKATNALDNNTEYTFYLINNTAVIYCRSKENGNIYIQAQTPGNSILINTAYNLVVTYNGAGTANGFKIYINGVLQTLTRTNAGAYTSMQNTSTVARVGNTTNGVSSRPFLGTIDEVYLFKEELSQLEVNDLQTKYYPNF